jgi:peptidoglycan/LPS O-acetylase OafA/YrhL
MSRVEERRAATVEAAPPLPRARGRITELDLLRFLAALAVVLFHYTARANPAWGGQDPLDLFPGLSEVSRYGFLGVQLFFMISGFVILMTAMGRDTAEFVTARITRLFPAYIFAVLLTSTFLTLSPQLSEGVTLIQVLTNFTMLQDGLGVAPVDGVYWTLWVELKFYLLIGLLTLFRVTYRSAVGFMTLWLASAVALRTEQNELLTTLLIPAWAPYFIIGMALYLVHRFGSNVMLWGLVLASWALAVSRAGELRFFGGLPDDVVTTDTVIWIVSGFVVVMSVMALGGLRWMRWRFLTTLGLLTYPLYLIHQWIGWVIIDRLRETFTPGQTVAIVVTIMLLASWAIARFIEAPAQRWLRGHFARSIAQMREASAQRRSSRRGSRLSSEPESQPSAHAAPAATDVEGAAPPGRGA